MFGNESRDVTASDSRGEGYRDIAKPSLLDLLERNDIRYLVRETGEVGSRCSVVYPAFEMVSAWMECRVTTLIACHNSKTFN